MDSKEFESGDQSTSFILPTDEASATEEEPILCQAGVEEGDNSMEIDNLAGEQLHGHQPEPFALPSGIQSESREMLPDPTGRPDASREDLGSHVCPLDSVCWHGGARLKTRSQSVPPESQSVEGDSNPGMQVRKVDQASSILQQIISTAEMRQEQDNWRLEADQLRANRRQRESGDFPEYPWYKPLPKDPSEPARNSKRKNIKLFRQAFVITKRARKSEAKCGSGKKTWQDHDAAVLSTNTGRTQQFEATAASDSHAGAQLERSMPSTSAGEDQLERSMPSTSTGGAQRRQGTGYRVVPINFMDTDPRPRRRDGAPDPHDPLLNLARHIKDWTSVMLIAYTSGRHHTEESLRNVRERLAQQGISDDTFYRLYHAARLARSTRDEGMQEEGSPDTELEDKINQIILSLGSSTVAMLYMDIYVRRSKPSLQTSVLEEEDKSLHVSTSSGYSENTTDVTKGTEILYVPLKEYVNIDLQDDFMDQLVASDSITSSTDTASIVSSHLEMPSDPVALDSGNGSAPKLPPIPVISDSSETISPITPLSLDTPATISVNQDAICMSVSGTRDTNSTSSSSCPARISVTDLETENMDRYERASNGVETLSTSISSGSAETISSSEHSRDTVSTSLDLSSADTVSSFVDEGVARTATVTINSSNMESERTVSTNADSYSLGTVSEMSSIPFSNSGDVDLTVSPTTSSLTTSSDVESSSFTSVTPIFSSSTSGISEINSSADPSITPSSSDYEIDQAPLIQDPKTAEGASSSSDFSLSSSTGSSSAGSSAEKNQPSSPGIASPSCTPVRGPDPTISRGSHSSNLVDVLVPLQDLPIRNDTPLSQQCLLTEGDFSQDLSNSRRSFLPGSADPEGSDEKQMEFSVEAQFESFDHTSRDVSPILLDTDPAAEKLCNDLSVGIQTTDLVHILVEHIITCAFPEIKKTELQSTVKSQEDDHNTEVNKEKSSDKNSSAHDPEISSETLDNTTDELQTLEEEGNITLESLPQSSPESPQSSSMKSPVTGMRDEDNKRKERPDSDDEFGHCSKRQHTE